MKMLIKLGLVSIDPDGKICWPFHVSPMYVVRYYITHGPRVYRFKNLPGAIKWIPGRLLPWRWGFGVCGIEFGDRGSSVTDISAALAALAEK